MTLFSNIECLVTVNANGELFKVGAAMQDLGVINNGAILFDEKIRWVGSNNDVDAAIVDLHLGNDDVEFVDCSGQTVMPGFVDSHTHMVFAGNRADEFARRLQGVPYTQIAAEGGGILTTMNAVREASVQELYDVAEALATSALMHGTTTIEIKSGYGLSVESELAQLEAIELLRETHEARIVPTFMGAHDVPPEFKHAPDEYVDLLINEMLPKVAEHNLAVFVDVFTDAGFFTVEQSTRILLAAKKLGFLVKVHADEISNIGASAMAAELGAVSADHLEFTTESDMDAMLTAGTVATLLPGTAYTLRLPYPPARKMIEKGLTVALATDCNPGSCFTENMSTVLSLACANMHMSIEESIVAATLNGAHALRMSNSVGSIEVGKLADLVIYDVPSYSSLVYHFGVNHVWSVWVGGEENV
ncbi:MAG: imidazolonepropionase [Ignavibacteria bacterium]|nr:imidazolonepropionase [Ignavibacteria bacterium]